MSLPAASDGISSIVGYSETATFISATYLHNGITWNGISFTSNGDIITLTTNDNHYIRISLACTDPSAVIATINEPIT